MDRPLVNGDASLFNADTFPVSSRQAQGLVQGVVTSVCCSRFSDRILILITQIERVGCLYQVASPSVSASLALPIAQPLASELAHLCLPPPDPSAHITRLLGSAPTEEEEALYELYIRQIAACVYGNVGTRLPDDDAPPWAGRGVIIGLSLKRRPETADEDGQDEYGTAARRTLAGVLELVMHCRTW